MSAADIEAGIDLAATTDGATTISRRLEALPASSCLAAGDPAVARPY